MELYLHAPYALGSTQHHIQWVLEVPFPWVKWPGQEADHSPVCSVEVKNELGYTHSAYRCVQ